MTLFDDHVDPLMRAVESAHRVNPEAIPSARIVAEVVADTRAEVQARTGLTSEELVQARRR